jgi:hypothetical protein
MAPIRRLPVIAKYVLKVPISALAILLVVAIVYFVWRIQRRTR